MKCFITGANGFIGFHLAKRLSGEGHQVRCLVRAPGKFENLSHLQGVSAVVGDMDNMAALEKGAKDCEIVFHLAAIAKPWSKDKTLPFRVNVKGTENILKASLNVGVRKFVYTSSAAVIGPSPGEEPIDEMYVRRMPFFNEYEETKHTAEKLVGDFSEKWFGNSNCKPFKGVWTRAAESR